MQPVDVNELFCSIQGESTLAGMPCFFVRLSGCNLACRYCDTPQARTPGGRPMEAEEIVGAYRRSGMPMAEITGGEPLLQTGCGPLAAALRDAGPGPVLVETNGSRSLAALPAGVSAVMDIKCPGSGEAGATDWENIGRLRPYDEVKFVVSDRADYEWAADIARRHGLAGRCRAVLFSPAAGALDPARLGEWLLRDGLPARLQLQLHKRLGMP